MSASPHWSKNFTEQYGNRHQTRQVALADVTGPGTEYLRELDAVATGNVTYGDKAELLDVQYQETTRQAGVLTKLAVKLAANAVGLGPWAEFALQAGVDSAISGEIDVESIAKDAAFRYASAELSSAAKTQLGISAPVEGQYFNKEFIQNTAIDATLNASTQTAIYGGSFSENLTDAYESSLINESTAFAQNFVGDIKGAEGSPIGVLGHGLVGCLSSDLSGGNCGQGAVSAAAGEIATGWADDAYGGDSDKVKELIRDTVNPTLAALTSGGDLGQFSINQGVNDSQLKNNYLSIHQKELRQQELDACDSLGCQIKVRFKWASISTGQDASFTAGLVIGIPESFYETGEDFLALISDPKTAYANLKEMVTRDDAFAHLSREIKQQYIDRINHLESEYQRAGAGGSYYAGVEAGKLAVEIGSLAVGGAGVIKGGAGLTAKALKAGAKIDVTDAPKGATELFSQRSSSFDPMDPEQFTRIQKAFARQGKVIDNSEDALRYLETRGADGVTFNADTILVRPDASPSTVFEELIHTTQHRTGRYDQWTSRYGNAGATAKAEYEAATRLVKNRRAYGISDAENAINQARVQEFGRQLDDIGVPRD